MLTGATWPGEAPGSELELCGVRCVASRCFLRGVSTLVGAIVSSFIVATYFAMALGVGLRCYWLNGICS